MWYDGKSERYMRGYAFAKTWVIRDAKTIEEVRSMISEPCDRDDEAINYDFEEGVEAFISSYLESHSRGAA